MLYMAIISWVYMYMNGKYIYTSTDVQKDKHYCYCFTADGGYMLIIITIYYIYNITNHHTFHRENTELT